MILQRQRQQIIGMRPNNQFNWRSILLLGSMGIIANTIWVAFNAFVPIFLQAGHPLAPSAAVTGLALSPLVANFIMTWDNILHMLVSPWIGARSDSTWTRFGRRKPWLLIGFPITLLGFTLIPFASSVVTIMLFILLTNAGTSLYRAPIRAWVGDFFSPENRSKAESLSHLIGGIIAILVAYLGGRLFDTVNRSAPFLLASGIVLCAFVTAVLFVQETRPLATAKPQQQTTLESLTSALRGPQRWNIAWVAIATLCFNAAHAAFQANLAPFNVFELNINAGRSVQLLGIATILYTLTAVPAGLLATRFSARRVMLAGILLYTLSALTILQVAVDERSFLIPFLLTGLSWALIWVNALPLMLNLDTQDRPGLFTGLYFVAFQLANIVGPLCAGGLIALFDTQRAMLGFVVVAMLAAYAALFRVKESPSYDANP